MKDYMRKRRGLNSKVLTTDVGLNKDAETKGLNEVVVSNSKGLTGSITVKQALDIMQELTPMKEVFIGGARYEVPC